VLAGVQYCFPYALATRERARDNRGLDELGARPHDGKYFHHDKSFLYSASNFSFSRSQL